MSNGPSRRVADLDAARKARQETAGDPPVVVLGGREFTLPHALPAAVLTGLAQARRGDLDGFGSALDSLFGDEVEDVLRLGLELADFDVIIEAAYGDEPGNSSGSATSSSSTSEPSKRT